MAEQKYKTRRIPEVDGLRTVAVIGVIWIHTWSAFGNPACMIGPIDVERAVAILGNGVDLFFVISGFCMYLLFAHQTNEFTFQKYGQFMGKRWKRIAPAFYMAAIVGAFIFWNRNESFPFYDLAAHFFFMHIWLPETGQLSPPFWSLATEWHFYLLLPFLIVSFRTRIGFWGTMWIAMGLSMLIRLSIYYFFPHKANFGVLTQIPPRFVEFGWGIIAARVYVSKKNLPAWLQGGTGFLFGCAVAYTGRIGMVEGVIKLAGWAGFLCQAFSVTILTLGYGLILLNVISSVSVFQRILSAKWITYVGKISYSLYLWHAWAIELAFELVVKQWEIVGVPGQLICFSTTLFVLIPFSIISYRYLESPYFRRHQPAVATV